MMCRRIAALLWLSLLAGPAPACELCAIYSANNARGQASSGFVVSISEQYTPYRSQQFDSMPVTLPDPDFYTSSMTHFVVGYNFTPRLGLSLNIPVVYHDYKITQNLYSESGGIITFHPDVVTRGHVFGLGDMSLIGRGTIVNVNTMKYSVFVNALAGIKFPTGGTEFITEEVTQAQLYDQVAGTVVHSDPLSHSISGVHPHDLSPGSGSVDVVTGLTLYARWQRWFFNTQLQYYLRSEGTDTFQFGNDFLASGGPGGYLILNPSWTMSLQLNAGYENAERDHLLGRVTNQTGMNGWYLGPQFNFTWGEHFSAQAGVDVPIAIENNGFQNVPDYRVHGGVNWAF